MMIMMMMTHLLLLIVNLLNLIVPTRAQAHTLLLSPDDDYDCIKRVFCLYYDHEDYMIMDYDEEDFDLDADDNFHLLSSSSLSSCSPPSLSSSSSPLRSSS